MPPLLPVVSRGRLWVSSWSVRSRCISLAGKSAYLSAQILWSSCSLSLRLKYSDLASSSVLVGPRVGRHGPSHNMKAGKDFYCCVPMGVWAVCSGRTQASLTDTPRVKGEQSRPPPPKKVQAEQREAGDSSKRISKEAAELHAWLGLCRTDRFWRQLTFRVHGQENRGHFGLKVINLALIFIILKSAYEVMGFIIAFS